MKHRLMLQVLVLSLMFILGISSASALGLGTYYNLGWGDGEIEYDDHHYGDVDIDTDHRGRAIGFVLDTNVAKNALFNYRLNVALDTIDFGHGLEADGYVMDHTFGFGVLRNKYVRLWLGPQINLAYYTDDIKFRDNNIHYKTDFDAFGIGVGPAMGVNIHAGDFISFTATTGYKYMFLFGDFVDDFTGYEGQYYINFGMLFRINDVYKN